ncbi:MAG: cytoplasmic protein, partial [Thermodesulfobacteriota bacterium]|nr:cytoplasmic protein [Thermodesulfobacteriota bacterium]
MQQHSHQFVEEYEGLVGFGFSREVDEYTITYYLQKFSDDRLMDIMRDKMSDSDMEELFNLLTGLLKKYLTEEEYH